MRNTTTTVVIAAGAVLAAVIVTRTPAQQEVGAPGACCLPSGGCHGENEPECVALGGTWLGLSTSCSGSQCPSVAPPTVVSVSVSKDGFPTNPTNTAFRVFRAWSDGQLDGLLVEYGPDCAIGGSTCGPVIIVPGTCTTDIDRDGDTGIQDFLTLLGGWGAC